MSSNTPGTAGGVSFSYQYPNESPLIKLLKESNADNSNGQYFQSISQYNPLGTVDSINLGGGAVSKMPNQDDHNHSIDPSIISSSQKLLMSQTSATASGPQADGSATTFPHTTDHRNVTLNNLQVTQGGFWMKNFPISRSFGNLQAQIAQQYQQQQSMMHVNGSSLAPHIMGNNQQQQNLVSLNTTLYPATTNKPNGLLQQKQYLTTQKKPLLSNDKMSILEGGPATAVNTTFIPSIAPADKIINANQIMPPAQPQANKNVYSHYGNNNSMSIQGQSSDRKKQGIGSSIQDILSSNQNITLPLYQNDTNGASGSLLNNSLIQSKLVPKGQLSQNGINGDNRLSTSTDDRSVSSKDASTKNSSKYQTANPNQSAIMQEDQQLKTSEDIPVSDKLQSTGVPSTGSASLVSNNSILARLNDATNLKDKIMIHVIDDNKNQKRDFQFSRSLLVKYMKYFDKCLKKISENDEIDISIHCDAGIFEWLLCYILAHDDIIKHRNGNKNQGSWSLKVQRCAADDVPDSSAAVVAQNGGPTLELKNVVSILISADFLKIELLVNECISFFVNNIEEMSKLQVDMSCINSSIIREIARQVDLDRLDVLKERKDKLISRLFMKKLEVLLEKNKNYLHRCGYCLSFFTRGQRKVLSCPKGRVVVDAQGRLRAHHAIDKDWDLKKFITYVRETYRISWKEIYWKVWAYLHVFTCQHCSQTFQLQQLANCAYHPKAPKAKMSPMSPGGLSFEYECCGQRNDIYKALDCSAENSRPTGCKLQLHTPFLQHGVSLDKQRKILQRVVTHQLIILENQSLNMIEEIKIIQAPGENHPDNSDTYQIQIVASSSQSCPTNIVKPSSLNYKIGLKAAVEEFLKKESKIEDFQIVVEEVKTPLIDESNETKTLFNLHEDLDDALYHVSVQVIAKLKPSQNDVALTNPGNGNQGAGWDKEEEKIKNRLEKSALNSLKYKYATQFGNIANNLRVLPQMLIDYSSGNGVIPGQEAATAQQQVVQPVQQAPRPQEGATALNADQLEEAKALTVNKLKQFKKDRLFQNDFERVGQLAELLKRVRVCDAQAFQKSPEAVTNAAQLLISPRPSQAAPSSVSPQKAVQGGGSNSVAVPNSLAGGQQPNVMTQISSIVNKRSRSTNYQVGIIGNNQTATGQPSNTIKVQEESIGITDPSKNAKGSNPSSMLENAMNQTKSQRVQRAKNVSPPSREKHQQFPQYYQGAAVVSTGGIGMLAPGQQERQSFQPSQISSGGEYMGTTAGTGFIGNGQQTSPFKVVQAGASLHSQYNAISAHGTFYNQQHRKTYSNKLPQIKGAAGGTINNKTIDSSQKYISFGDNVA